MNDEDRTEPARPAGTPPRAGEPERPAAPPEAERAAPSAPPETERAAAPPPPPPPGRPPGPPPPPPPGRAWLRPGGPGPGWLPVVLVGIAMLLIGCMIGGGLGLAVGHFTGRHWSGPGHSRFDDRRPGMPHRPGMVPRKPTVPAPATPSPSPSAS